MSARRIFIAIAATSVLAGPASAQLLGGGGVQLPGLPRVDLPTPGELTGTLGQALDPRGLANLRLDRLRDLVRTYPRDLELDPAGAPVVRGEVVATGMSDAAVSRAQAQGFRVARSETLEALELSVTVLAPPEGMSAREAVRRLRRLDPAGSYDFNHIYLGASLEIAEPVAQAGAAATVGLIDTGVDARHPALAGVAIEQRGFSLGPKAADHGTAVASLLTGRGGRLLAADVYGSTPRGGSAEAVAQAFAWMAASDAKVINVSLVGPKNALLEASVAAVQRKGRIVVAAVGNDGPAAPPAYPASFPGVIAVTGVDRRGRVLPEAGRALHVDFAALGSDVDFAGSKLRGTSFASPVVARALAQEGSVEAVARRAQDLGAKGVDKVFGRGLVTAR